MPFVEDMQLAKHLKFTGGVDAGEEAFRAMLVMEVLNSTRSDVYTVPSESQWAFVQLATAALRVWRAWAKEHPDKAEESVPDQQWMLLHEECVKWREMESYAANEARKAAELTEAGKAADAAREAETARIEAERVARHEADLAALNEK